MTQQAIAWIKAKDRLDIILTAFSGLFLLLSLTLNPASNYNIDFAWGAIIISGIPILYSSAKGLLVDYDIKAGLLVSIALIACIISKEYFAAGEIVFIMTIGELLEDYTVKRSKQGLQNLIELQPTKARVFRNGSYLLIDPQNVKVGEKVRITAGESIPVDGTVIEGVTTIDQSIMTGESVPVDKTIGDEVYSATTNIHGNILITATKVGADSSIAKMIHMIKEAENKKAPILSIMDRWASILVVVALVLSIVIGFVTQDIIRAITVLVVFCPCALVLATPTAIAAGIANATKHGVIIKSGKALEGLNMVTQVAFDKTGTLTEGDPKVDSIHMFSNTDYSENDILQLAASAEQHSEHPFGKAILQYAQAHEIKLQEPKEFSIIPARGVTATIGNKSLIIGNYTLLLEKNITLTAENISILEQHQQQGNTAIIIAIDQAPCAVLALKDRLREDSKDIISKLHRSQLHTSLLTGDHREIAKEVAKATGIDDFRSDMLPQDKVQAIEEFEKAGTKTCMIGDGINDAPALKTAHIGIALAGIGSDIASDSADIVLVKDDLGKLPYVFKLSRRVMTNVRQNITMALTINFVAIILAGTGILTPVTGALVHNVGSVLVVLNAALLLNIKTTDY